MLNKLLPSLLLLISVSTPSIVLADLSHEIESMVTCNLNDENPEIAIAIYDENKFKPEGENFYTPTNKITTFGYEVKYLGVRGVDMVPGPNITVKGQFEDVKKTILGKVNNKFECGPGGCGAKVTPVVQIMIYSHPNDKNLTIIQCGYFGP